MHSINKDIYLFYTYLATLIWLPLPLGSNRTWSAMLFFIIVSCIFGFWLMLFSRNKAAFSDSFKRAWPVLLLLFVAQLYVAFQYLTNISIDPSSTFKELLLGTGYYLFFCLSLLLLNSSKRIKITIYVVVASGLFQAIYGSLMTLSHLEYGFFVKKDAYIGVATGTFINRNHLAGYLIICLSIGLGMMIATLNSHQTSIKGFIINILRAFLSKKIILRISLIIMVAALVMTHSRMGNTAFFASLGIIGTLAILLKRRSVASTIILLASLLLIDIAVVGTFFGVNKVIDRIESTSTSKESRDEVNLFSIKLINDNLLTGTGAGTFYTAFPHVRKKEVGFLFYDHAHNDYIEFLSERGVIGIVPLALTVIITFFVALKALWKRHNPLMRGCAFACLMSMLAMAIHATVDFNLQIPANAATFMLVLALGWISAFHKPRKKREKSLTIEL